MWTLSYDIVPKFFFFESSGNSRAGRNDFKQICECSEVWRDIETWIFRYPIFSSHQQWIGILIHRSILRVICLNPVAPNDTWRDLDSPQACDGRDQRQPQSMPWRSPGLRLAATGCDWLRLATGVGWGERNTEHPALRMSWPRFWCGKSKWNCRSRDLSIFWSRFATGIFASFESWKWKAPEVHG